MEIYVVKSGDTVNAIAGLYGVGAQQIIFDNQLIYPYELAVGQALFIGSGEREATRAINAGGYAYPFISRWVLNETLPFLSELLVFSYGFTPEGMLVEPLWDDEWMIEAAMRFGTRPILTLTPFGEDGQFNNQLISKLINNQDSINMLINELLRTMEQKRYMGVDIDFEFIKEEDRDAFSAFVGNVAETMRAYGYETSVALAPKTSKEQRGILVSGKDYRALGEAADYVLLMTYEWGYTYGPPMAVAPLNQVRRVVEYALTEIPAEKINLGIPNYGYDWPLPFERGVTAARTINNVQAVRIAIEQRAEIQFDEISMSPYFTYTENGIRHEVWFEDVRSLTAKFDLIKEYNLRGCSYWQIMQFFRANWLSLREQFYIRK